MENTFETTGSRPVFHCRQCGECCQGQGGILVNPEEIERLAAFLHLSGEDFAREYLVASQMGPQLASRNGACVFLAEKRCRIHPVKPRLCRDWPFLSALLTHPDELEGAKGACPGIDPACRHQDFVRAAGTQD